MKACFSKQYLCVLCVVVAFGGGAIWWAHYKQRTTLPTRVALINSTKIKNKAEPFVRVRAWFEKQCQHTQSDLTNKVHELQKTYEWLKVAPKDKRIRERHDKFRKEVSVLEHVVQERKENLTQQFTAISSFLEDKLKQVIAELARSQNVSLVLNQHIHDVQAILYADDRVIDLTDDVIKHLNQETDNLHLPDATGGLKPVDGEEEKVASS